MDCSDHCWPLWFFPGTAEPLVVELLIRAVLTSVTNVLSTFLRSGLSNWNMMATGAVKLGTDHLHRSFSFMRRIVKEHRCGRNHRIHFLIRERLEH